MIAQPAQRGSLLVAAVILVTVLALLASTLSFLFVGSSTSSSDHLSAAKALFVAESGLERATYQYENGITCSALGATNIAVGEGSFSVTAARYTAAPSLSATIAADATTIPISTLTGLAPHGRVRIASEEINYSGTGSGATQCGVGITGACLTGAKRERDGTSAVTQTSGTAVRQRQCLIRSTGTALNTQRVIERTLRRHSEFFDGANTTVATNTNLGGTPGILPPGHNHVVAVVSLNSTNRTATTINPAAMLLLKNNTTTLASNQYEIVVGGGATPSDDAFNQKTFFFVYRDPNALADDAYNVRVTANNANAQGEVKMLTFNNVAISGFQPGVPVTVEHGSLLPLLSYAYDAAPLSGQIENVVLAAIQIKNNEKGQKDGFIAPGDLRLYRGTTAGTLLDSNPLRIDVRAERNNPNAPNNTISVLLMARDTAASANQLYTVAVRPDFGSSNRYLSGQASLLVLSQMTSRFGSGTVTLNTTPILSHSTDLLDGMNMVINTTQFENISNNQSVISSEQITHATAAVSSSEFNRNLCSASGGSNASALCNDFFSGLVWSSSTAATASYNVQATANVTPVTAAAKTLVVQAPRGIVDWQEIFP